MGSKEFTFEILDQKSDFSEWDNLLDSSPQGTVFAKSWWLKCVCNNSFNILVCRDRSGIVCGFPLNFSSKYGLNYSMMPRFTQTLGPIFRNFEGISESKKRSIEIHSLSGIINIMPSLLFINTNFHYSYTNLLPFIWEGYETSVRYTYIIDNRKSVNSKYQSISPNYKNKIKKAKKSGLRIIETDDINLLVNTIRKSLDKVVEIDYSLIEKLDQICKENNARKIYLAKDLDERIHSGLFVVYNKNFSYNLLQGGDPNLRKNGSNILAMWHSIIESVKYSNVYDFEGSMLRNIEQVFRSFGGVQMPYYAVTKNCLSDQLRYISKNIKHLFKKSIR